MEKSIANIINGKKKKGKENKMYSITIELCSEGLASGERQVRAIKGTLRKERITVFIH